MPSTPFSPLSLVLLAALAAPAPSQTVASSRDLFDGWLRHPSAVVDVEWGAGGDLFTVDSGGAVVRWDGDRRAAAERLDDARALDLAVDRSASPDAGVRGLALAVAPRAVEWRATLGAEPRWRVDDVGGPLAFAPDGRHLAAVGGADGAAVVELLAAGDGARRVAVELGSFDVRAVAIAGGELAVLGYNRLKQLGRKGTEEQPRASLWLVDVDTGTQRARHDVEGQPRELLRRAGEWVLVDADGRAWSVGEAVVGPFALAVPADAEAGGIACSTVVDGARLVHVDERGATFARLGLEAESRRGASVGVGARAARAAKDAPLVAVAVGTTVRIVDGALASVGGAAGFGSQVSALAFDAAGARLLGAGYDHSVRVFAVAGGAELTVERAVGIVHGAAWADDGAVDARIAWVARGGALSQRALGAAADAATTAVRPGAPWTDVAGGGGDVVAALTGGGVQLARGPELRAAWSAQGPRGTLPRVALAGERVVVAASGLAVLARADGAVLGALGDMGAPVQSLGVAAAAPRAAVGLASGAVALVDLERVALGATVAQHRGRVQAVALTPDARLLASVGTNDGALAITTLDANGEPTAALSIPWEGPPCTALAFAPDGATLAAGGQDGAVRLFVLER